MSNILYDSKQNATELMRKIMRDLHSSYNLRQVPPPPKSTTQIVKLQWVPSQNPNLKESDDGVWHGLFALHLGKLQSNTQLQQCSLTAEWVESAFSRINPTTVRPWLEVPTIDVTSAGEVSEDLHGNA